METLKMVEASLGNDMSLGGKGRVSGGSPSTNTLYARHGRASLTHLELFPSGLGEHSIIEHLGRPSQRHPSHPACRNQSSSLEIFPPELPPFDNASMLLLPAKTSEAIPRLGKEEVDFLEREFKRNPKPTTKTKRQFAEDMCVDLARINNWFQNRRARRRYEEKIEEAHETVQAQDVLGYSEPSSPDFYNGSGYFSDVPIQLSQASFPLMNNGPPPTIAPQYTDPLRESIESPPKTPQAQTASPVEGGMNFVFNASVPSCFTTIEGDQNLASPPEISQAQMAIHSSGNGWPTGVEFHKKQWHFEVPDEPLYTPSHDTFNLELQMLQRNLHAVQASCDLQVPPSPTPYQMRRIDAAAGNRDVLFGRIHRSGIEPQQHSTPLVGDFMVPDAESFMEHSDVSFEGLPPLTEPSSTSSANSSVWCTPQIPGVREFLAPHITSELDVIWRKPEVLDDSEYDILHECLIHALKPQLEADEVVPKLSNETTRNAKRAGSLTRNVVAGTRGEFQHTSNIANSSRLKVGAAETYPAEVTVEQLKPTWKTLNSISKNQENSPMNSVDQVSIKLEGGTGIEADDKNKEQSMDDNCVFEGLSTEQIDSPYEQGFSTNPRPALDFDNGEYDSVLPSTLEDMRQALVEHFMDEFWFIYAQEWTTATSGNSPTSPNRNRDFRKPESIAPCQTFQRKRQRDDDEDQPDDNGDKNRRQQRDRPGSSSNSHRRGRFACPFRKHDCQKYSVYSHRVCALTSWDTIARVKEHLYRNHRTAPFCKRCWQVFETDELLDSHETVAAALICEILPGQPPEGITPKQVTELKSKAKLHPNQSEGDRWKEIFKLLFPGEDVPSPYWEPIEEQVPPSPDSQVLALYDGYMHRELPSLFRSRVEEAVRREMQPVAASLLGSLDLVGLLRECQDQLSRAYPSAAARDPTLVASPIGPAGAPAGPMSQQIAQEGNFATLEQDQQYPYDFFSAVLKPLPMQEGGHAELDLSWLNDDLQASASICSDSGYASGRLCNCSGPCRCPVALSGSENHHPDTSSTSLVDPSPQSQVPDQYFQWQEGLEDRD